MLSLNSKNVDMLMKFLDPATSYVTAVVDKENDVIKYNNSEIDIIIKKNHAILVDKRNIIHKVYKNLDIVSDLGFHRESNASASYPASNYIS